MRNELSKPSLIEVPGDFAICRLEPHAGLPGWAWQGSFCSVTRTPDELSVVCLSQDIPLEVRSEGGWRCLKLSGPLPLDLVGILLSVLQPLATAHIAVLAIGSFDTDYVFVKGGDYPKAIAALRDSGFEMKSVSSA